MGGDVQLRNLQSLRAIAAINVVIFHTIGVVDAARHGTGVLSFLAGWGENGVDIFFVLSGFVIYLSQAQNPKAPARFILNRISRISPNYWGWTLLLALCLALMPGLFPHLKLGLFHLISSLLFCSQPLTGMRPLFYVGWTLEYEMLFYSLFWVALCTGIERAPLVITPVILLFLVTTTGLPLIALEFLFGMGIAVIFLGGKPNIPPILTFSIGVAVLLMTIFVKLPGDRILFWGIPAALLVHGAVFLPELKAPRLEFLGNASYSIYLVQVATIPLVLKVSDAVFPGLPLDFLIFLITAATVVAGALNFLWFERPASAWLRKIGREASAGEKKYV